MKLRLIKFTYFWHRGKKQLIKSMDFQGFLKAADTPVILVSHNDALLSAVSDRVLTLEKGRLIEQKKTENSGMCPGMIRVIDLSKHRKRFSA